MQTTMGKCGLVLGASVLVGALIAGRDVGSPLHLQSGPSSDQSNELSGKAEPYGWTPTIEEAFAVGRSFGEDVSVIRGRVRSVGGDRWSTPDGVKRQGQGPGGIGSGGALIYRTAQVEVLDVIAGEPVRARVVPVTLLGGEVAGVAMSVSEAGPQLEADEDVILVVAPGRLTQDFAPGNWVILLKYRVERGLAVGEAGDVFTESDLASRAQAAALKD